MLEIKDKISTSLVNIVCIPKNKEKIDTYFWEI
jgi:hypothetical protein